MTNRELDALVAEKVMGIKTYNRDISEVMPDGSLNEWTVLADMNGFPIPEYSTDISAAWEVVEQLDTNFRLHNTVNGEYKFWIYNKKDKSTIRTWASGKSAPIAICKAALKTKEIEIE